MNARIVVRPQAEADIDEIADWFADEEGLAKALEFLDSAYATFALVATQPEMGWLASLSYPRLGDPRLEGMRVFRVTAPFEKYLLFYQVQREVLEIVRVVHGARDLEELLWPGRG